MIQNSLVVTDSGFKSGVGKYAWGLYNFGFFENFCHLSYNGKSDFKNYVFLTNYWGINTLTSYYIGSVYKKYVQKFNFVHASSIPHFHLVKYNKNMAGTLLDFFGLEYPMSRYIYSWTKKNLKYLPKLRGIVVISDYIKKSAEQKYPNLEFNRIHLWLDDQRFQIRDKNFVRKKLSLDESKVYLLNVSRDVPRKNIDVLPPIINKLDERFVLIRIGDTGRIIDKFKNKNQIIQLLNVPDDLYSLYFNASNMLLHTSIDGGFEIPYLESIFSNLPVVTYDLPISKEVLRDKAIFINMSKNKTDPEDWVEKILKYYDQKIEYGNLKDYYKPERAKKEYEYFYKGLEVF